MSWVYTPKDFGKIANLGDKVIFGRMGVVRDGYISMITERGCDVRLNGGIGGKSVTWFVKWIDVKELIKSIK